MLCSTAFAASINDLPTLSEAQLGAVSGGQEIVQTDQGTAALSAERGSATAQNLSFGPGGGGAGAAFAAQTPGYAGNAAAPFGTAPILGQLVGSSGGVRYGN